MTSRIHNALLAWKASLSPDSGDALVSSLRSLDALRAEAGNALHPQLAHFLERRSYEKALRWLEESSKAAHP